jgi:hypothetical protein
MTYRGPPPPGHRCLGERVAGVIDFQWGYGVARLKIETCCVGSLIEDVGLLFPQVSVFVNH